MNIRYANLNDIPQIESLLYQVHQVHADKRPDLFIPGMKKYTTDELTEIIEDDKQGIIRVFLKYGQNGERVITNLKRVSKPGLRVYKKREDLPKVLNGLGIAILSTSEGLLTDKEARQKNVGGEVIAYVW